MGLLVQNELDAPRVWVRATGGRDRREPANAPRASSCRAIDRVVRAALYALLPEERSDGTPRPLYATFNSLLSVLYVDNQGSRFPAAEAVRKRHLTGRASTVHQRAVGARSRPGTVPSRSSTFEEKKDKPRRQTAELTMSDLIARALGLAESQQALMEEIATRITPARPARLIGVESSGGGGACPPERGRARRPPSVCADAQLPSARAGGGRAGCKHRQTSPSPITGGTP
jgi:hypothetical protein